MLRWEYCMLSGVETSMNRKICLSLTFSNADETSKRFDVRLDHDRSEELFTTRYLGELGREGWEVVAFHRAAPKFEAVLKRPVVSYESRATP